MARGHWVIKRKFTKTFTQSRENAKKTVRLCFDNAKDHLEDAKVLISQGQISHIVNPIEFALEELGKADFIIERLKENTQTITYDFLLHDDSLYKHETKAERIIPKIKLSDYDKHVMHTRIANWFTSIGHIPIDSMVEDHSEQLNALNEDELKNHALKGSNLRMDTNYVNIDHSTGEPSLDRPINHDQGKRWVNSLTVVLMDLEKDFSKL